MDLDTQANLTRHFFAEIPSRIVYHAIRERKDLPIYPVRQNLDLTPSGLEMAGIEIEMTNMRRREDVLKDLLEPQKSRYDFSFHIYYFITLCEDMNYFSMDNTG